MKHQVVFVILHYNSIECTRKCIASILDLEWHKKPGIVLVDNASPNQTGEVLAKEYAEHEEIRVLLQRENLGFARGNNIGYLYAKKEMGAECIICANNDVCFVQKDFLPCVEKICKAASADVIGPDIQTYNEVHQNPFRESRLSAKQFRRKHLMKYGWLFYWSVCKVFPFLSWGEKLGEKDTGKIIAERNYREAKADVVLQGACILFMKNYIDKEEEAFVPDTFLYMEEDILAYKCLIKGYRMQYHPELVVFHAEGVSTKESILQKADRKKFYYRECLESDKVLAKYIKVAGDAKKKDSVCVK